MAVTGRVMSKLRILIVTGLLIVSIGCQRDQSLKSSVASSEQIQNWLSLYESLENGLRSEVDPQFRPEILLPKLHSWFGDPNNLSRAVPITNSWSLHTIQPIPNDVLADLDRVLIDDEETRTSFVVLTKSFWHAIKDAQKRVSIGFLSFDNPTNVFGIYFHHLKLVGLDIFSDQGTLPHELRHLDQALRLEKIKKVYRKAQWTPHLRSECLAVASNAFGEVDATSWELAKGVHSRIETEIAPFARCGFRSSCEGKDSPAFPQASFFSVNMSYPALALSRILTETTCDASFRQAVRKLKDDQELKSSALSTLLRSLSYVSIGMTRARLDHLAGNCNRQETLACNQTTSQLEDSQKLYESLRARFVEGLERERQDRPKRFMEWTKTLPARLKEDLCRSASGFENIADCRTELSAVGSESIQ